MTGPNVSPEQDGFLTVEELQGLVDAAADLDHNPSKPPFHVVTHVRERSKDLTLGDFDLDTGRSEILTVDEIEALLDGVPQPQARECAEGISVVTHAFADLDRVLRNL